MASDTKRRERLELRLPRATRRLLQKAANAAGQSLNDFVVESAVRRATGDLQDRRVYLLNDPEWNALTAALDTPPKLHPRLARLFADPSVFRG
jgi:uncharacterized protein (DUF1778 family)